MNGKFRYASAALMMLLVSTAWSGQTQVAIFENGEYMADVVLPESVGGVEKFAVEELVYHFKKAFGKEPEIVGEDKFADSRRSFHIFVGATRTATAAGLPVGKLAGEEHVVKTVGNGLYLFGGDGDTTYDEVFRYNDSGDSWDVAMRGTLYAVYDFLENEMGVKWLWPGETGEVVPKRAALKVGGIYRRAREPLESRFFHGKKCKVKTGFTSDEAAERFYHGQRKFLLRQRHGTKRKFAANHSFQTWWKQYGKEHPEYFNMLPNGKRMPHRAPQLCTMCVSEPGVWNRRVDEWCEWWKKAAKERHPPYPWVNCCDNDGTALCTCPRCRSWDGPDPRFEKSDYWNGNVAKDFDEKYLGKKLTGLGLSNGSRWTIPRYAMWSDEKAASVSDRYVRFYNEVAALARRYCPEAKAVGYAYVNYIDPPLKTRVGPDTVIIFVPRSYFPYDEVESANFRRQWGGWHRMGAERMVLRPNYMLAGGNHPIDTARRIVDDFAFAYTNGMIICQQDSITGAWSAQAMHLYALSRMMRDPLRGYEKAREDMLAGFGAAAPAVNRYFDRIEANSARWTYESYRAMGLKNITGNLNDVGGSFRNPNAILADFFDEEFFKDGYEFLDEGIQSAAGDEEVVARIEFLRKGLRDTELGRNCRIAQKASDADPDDKAKKAAYDAAFKALVDYRASVEGDFVCDYAHHADWERMFVGWPHAIRGSKAPQSKKVWGE